MGKSRQKSHLATKGRKAGSQPKNVFSVSRRDVMKARRKAKAIDVKKLNSQVQAEVGRVNRTTTELQQALVRVQKGTEGQQDKKTNLKAKAAPGTNQPPPDMDAAASQFALL